MKSDDPIRQNLKERFGDYEVEPDQRIKERVLSGVSAAAQQGRGSGRKWALLGIVLIGTLVTYLLWQRTSQSNFENTPKVSGTVPTELPGIKQRRTGTFSMAELPGKKNQMARNTDHATYPLSSNMLANRISRKEAGFKELEKGLSDEVGSLLDIKAGMTKKSTGQQEFPSETGMSGQNSLLTERSSTEPQLWNIYALSVNMNAVAPKNRLTKLGQKLDLPILSMISKPAGPLPGKNQSKKMRWSVGINPNLSYQRTTIPADPESTVEATRPYATFQKERLGVQIFGQSAYALSPRTSLAATALYSLTPQWDHYDIRTGKYQITYHDNIAVINPAHISVDHENYQHRVGLRLEGWLLLNRDPDIPQSFAAGVEWQRAIREKSNTLFLVSGFSKSLWIGKRQFAVEPNFRYGLNSSRSPTDRLIVKPYQIGINIRLRLDQVLRN